MVALLSCIRTIGFVSADEGVFRKEVFLEWALAAKEKGKYLALTPERFLHVTEPD